MVSEVAAKTLRGTEVSTLVSIVGHGRGKNLLA
jgi:hypothetical protein